jgi:hypothetical protein
VKLVEGKQVQTAYRGFKKLSDHEVRSVYNDPPIMDWLDYPKVTRNFE